METLIEALTHVNWKIESDTVQGCWNEIQNELITIVDMIIPCQKFKNNSSAALKTLPLEIKNLINRRKRLLAKPKRGLISLPRQLSK
jgi:hypothetical protein